uniref:Uncharacterized protein n=1 Tax=Rhizophora mucronata TaxID=61149 RepID=A0A2P2NYD7_RHIMU
MLKLCLQIWLNRCRE